MATDRESAPSLLIVEDDEGLALLIQRKLTQLGWKVRVVHSSESAIAEVSAQRPDMMLLDYSLADSTADEFLKLLQSSGLATAFVVATGHGNESVAVDMMKMGALDYLVKDNRFLDQLPAVLNRALNKLAIDKRLMEAERELRQSEARFRSTFEHAHIGMLVLDGELRIISANDSIAQTLGYERQAMQGQSLESLLHPDDWSSLAARIRQLDLADTRRVTMEKRCRHSAGEQIWCNINISELADQRDRPERYIVQIENITQRHLAGEQLLDNNRVMIARNRIYHVFLTDDGQQAYGKVLPILLEITESTHGLFASVEDDGSLLFHGASEAVYPDCGLDMTGEHIPHNSWAGIWRRAIAERRTQISNFQLSYPAGHIPMQRALFTPIMHLGKVVSLIGVANKASDYTSRDVMVLEEMSAFLGPVLALRQAREAEERTQASIRQMDANWRALSEHSPNLVMLLDPEARIRFANRGFRGRSVDSLIGRPLAELLPPEQREEAEHCAAQVMQSRSPHSFDVDFGLTQEPSRYYNVSVGPVTQGDTATGLVASIADISVSRRLQTEMMRMDKLESLGVLAGGIAHDLNNQLTSIVGNLSLARVETSERARNKWLEDAERGSYRIKDLTMQLLTFSKGGAPVLKSGDVTRVVRDATNFSLTGSRIAVDFDFAPDTWTIEQDAGQIHQVISNLVINARQAMPYGGRLSLRIRNRHLKEDAAHGLQAGPYVWISIEDQGGGIPEAIRDKIFDPFFTTKPEGNGLGLATAHSIVRKHQGHLDFEVIADMGTRFNIYLPASASRQTETEVPESGPTQRGGGRLLVMDDDEQIRVLLRRLLESLGYTVSISGMAIRRWRNTASASAGRRPSIWRSSI